MKTHLFRIGFLFALSACSSLSPKSSIREQELNAETQNFLIEVRSSEFCSFGSEDVAPYLLNPNAAASIKDMSGLLAELDSHISSPRVKLDRVQFQNIVSTLPEGISETGWKQIAAAISCNVFGRFLGFRALANHDYTKSSTRDTAHARTLLRKHLDSRASGPEILFLPILLRLTLLEEGLKNRTLSLSKANLLGEVTTLRLALKETSGLAMKYHKLLDLNDSGVASSSLRYEFQSAKHFEELYSSLLARAW